MERNNLHYTNIEKKVKYFLDKNQKDYIFQYPTRTGFVIDFALLKERIAIEVDGTNWYSSKKAKKRDRFKNYMLRREGWKVIRIKEEEIDNLGNCLIGMV